MTRMGQRVRFAMTDKRLKQPVAPPKERVRYEVYGMPIEGIIAGAMVPEREAAVARAKAEAEAKAAAKDAAAWPTLEQLQDKRPSTPPRSRRPRR